MSTETLVILITAGFIGSMGYIVWFCWGEDDE